MRQYQRVKACPKELIDILAWVNWLRRRGDRQELIANMYEACDGYTGDWDRTFATWRAFIKIFEYADLARRFIGGGCLSQDTVLRTYDRFIELSDSAVVLKGLALLSSTLSETFLNDTPEEFTKANRFFQETLTIRRLGIYVRFDITLPFEITSKGLIRPRQRGLAKLLTENDIAINRIKECPICSSIFWATRISAQTCGNKRCADTLSQRRRRLDPEMRSRINQRRRENYKYKKKRRK
jgi:hypothetical protein